MLLPEGFAKGSEAAIGVEPRRRAMLLAIPAMALLVAVRAVMPLHPPENEANPWKLIAAVPPELRSQPVLNGYSMGGPLILSGIRPYIDGRGDMYGDELVLGFATITNGNQRALDDAVRRWNIRWAILPNTNVKLTHLLDRSPEWRRIKADKVGAIYVRKAPASAS
jgi:hypothetical protein